jgi:hypothetical protein
MKHLTVRDVPAELAEALEEERRRRGTSLGETVLDLLRVSLGMARPARRSNGLARLAGTWTDEDLMRFDAAIATTEGTNEGA